MIRVNADLFRIVYSCVSKEDTRYYLGGVFITPHHTEGVLMVATDGHRLLAAHDVQGKADKSAIIKLSPIALKTCKPVKREHARLLTVGHDNDTATISVQHYEGEDATVPVGISTDCIIDGTFPDWRRVMPTFKKHGEPGAFNPTYLSSFGSVAKELGAVSLRVLCNDASSPAIVRFQSIDHVFGVIMPMRATIDTKLPTWLNDRSPVAQAA